MAEVTLDYRELVKRLLREHAALKPSYGEIDTEVVFDDAQGHYEVIHAGWIGQRRIHGPSIHIDIRDGKIWIQHDGTERGVAVDLMEAGVPSAHIVLAWQPPYVRVHTPFAAS